MSVHYTSRKTKLILTGLCFVFHVDSVTETPAIILDQGLHSLACEMQVCIAILHIPFARILMTI